jgi:hypothetical protein
MMLCCCCRPHQSTREEYETNKRGFVSWYALASKKSRKKTHPNRLTPNADELGAARLCKLSSKSLPPRRSFSPRMYVTLQNKKKKHFLEARSSLGHQSREQSPRHSNRPPCLIFAITTGPHSPAKAIEQSSTTASIAVQCVLKL